MIERNWPDHNVAVESITADMVLALAQSMAHFCPSRWNTAVAAMRYITPHGKILKRRPLRIRAFRPPTQEEFAALLAECDRLPRTRAGLIVRFLSFTGMRFSEARALTWLHVFDDRIEVPAEATKNGKGRAVPLIAGAKEVLDRLRPMDHGGYVLPRQNARKAIEKASKQALGVRWSHHSCRHLFATRCIQSGVDLPTVARWLGHRDGGALLAKTYYHLADEHSRKMAARVQI